MPYFYIVLLVCGIDQAVKFWVQAKLIPFQSINLFHGWFSITYVSNYGAAFGILQSQTLLLLGVASGTFVYIWLNRREMQKYPKLFQIGIAIALGGALGNFIDRLRQGFVTDYLDLHFWPVFNFADVAIVGGVGLIVAGMLYQEMQQRRHGTSAQDSKEEKL
ncbi:MAG TPA: signal peptidase II [Bacillota bacterium]|nr:signal peptidase II [Bacillota bacterium]